MSQRSYLVGLLKNDSQLEELIGHRVHQGSAIRNARIQRPYVVYHLGNETDEMLAELNRASRRFFQIYIHDDIGDYDRIDRIGERIKTLLRGQGSPENRIIMTRFLERSQDLEDETLNTIFSYLRFQWVLGS